MTQQIDHAASFNDSAAFSSSAAEYTREVTAVETPAEPFVGTHRLTLGIVLGVLTFWLFAQTLLVAGPAIRESIGISAAELSLATSVTGLISGCFIVVAGGLADKFGRMRFTYLGFILSIVGSLLLIFANNAIIFTIGRIIQGFSAACIMPATLALMKTYYEGAARQTALSWWSVGSWGGSGVCSLAGGAIVSTMGWKWIFIFSIITAVAGMFLIKGTPESKTTESSSKFDYVGLVLFVISLLSLNIFITKGGELGWSSPIILVSIAIFVVALFTFVSVEQRMGDKAFIDFSLFKNMPYSGASFSNFMLNAVAGSLFVVNMYIQDARGFTALQTGMLSIGYLIAVLCMIPVGQIILQKMGAKQPMLLGTIVTGSGVAMMSLTFLPGTPYVVMVFLGFVFFGLGLGFYATPSTDTAVSNAPESKVGVASGIYKMASSLGGAFGVAISATVYSMLLSAEPTIAELNMAGMAGLLVNVGFCVLSFLSIIILVPKNAGRNRV